MCVVFHQAHAGYEIVSSEKDADVCVLNSCTVKNPSEDVFINAINSAKSSGRKVVLAGCVPQGDRKNKSLQNSSVVGVQQIDRVVEVVEQTLQGNVVKLFSRKKTGGGADLSLPKIRRNPLIEILPINQGYVCAFVVSSFVLFLRHVSCLFMCVV